MHLTRTFARDLSLFRQGLSLLREIGPHGLGEMVRVAEFLERAIYEEGSFRTTSDGFQFRLLNPPMRMGAFSSAQLSLDGRPLPVETSYVQEEGAPARRALSELSRASPLHFRPGRPTLFQSRCPDLVAGSRHTLQLSLQSVAIPPRVWMRFTDELRRGL